MALIVMDCKGLRCPQPVLKLAAKANEMKPGDVCEITADCPTFSKDVKMWCERSKKTLLFCTDEGGGKFKAQIQF
jgi:TusA-related sulfurtransferase